MKQKKLFNPEGIDSLADRKLIGGNTTNLFNLNNVKYAWANNLYRAMMANFWIPEKVDLGSDKVDYMKLTKEEQRAYNGILSFLVFLDSIQTNNLPNINDFITAPEVNLALSVQTYQEAIHSQSYAYVIESVVPKAMRESIYEFWKDDKILFDRNEYIAAIYQGFVDQSSEQNFGKVLVADYLLEGIYFYNGFNFFYNLASRNLMTGTKDIIKYINKDELTHMVLFEKIIKTVREENVDIIPDDMIYSMMEESVNHEIQWSNHIIGDSILGMSPQIIESYTKWLANNRLKKLGLKKLYDVVNENPLAHLDKIADTGSEGDSKANMFENTVTSYNHWSIYKGWDEL